MVGILVHGDNHFIVSGPLPDRATAFALARQWSIIQIEPVSQAGGRTAGQIGQSTPVSLQAWTIVTRAFRENLQWAVIVPGDGETSPAVVELLGELAARGIKIHDVQPAHNN